MRSAAVILCFALIATHALAFDSPQRKSGLWEFKSSSAGQKTEILLCIDEKTDDVMAQQGSSVTRQTCSRSSVRQEGDKMIGESICKTRSGTASTRSVFKGTFDSAYRVEARTTYDPPLQGMKETTTVVDAKWTGPCRPGQKPGDFIVRSTLR